MYDRLLTALNRFKGTRDQLFPALCQHLNIYVIRNHIMLNQVGAENRIQSDLLPGNQLRFP